MTDLTTSRFAGLRILVVEDEFLVALALQDMLTDFGCTVVGPHSTIEEASAAAETEPLDGALLDIDIRGQPIDPVVERLTRRGIPLVLCSGHAERPGEDGPGARHAGLPRIVKPYGPEAVRQAMEAAFPAARQGGPA